MIYYEIIVSVFVNFRYYMFRWTRNATSADSNHRYRLRLDITYDIISYYFVKLKNFYYF